MSDGLLGVTAGWHGDRVRRAAALVSTLALTLTLGACAGGNAPGLQLGADRPKASDIATSSTAEPSASELEKATAYWGEEHAKNPRNAKAALAFARNLKAQGRKPEALNVLQSSYMLHSNNREFLSEYGRLALEQGQVTTAGELLARADDPAKPDWRIISARGTVLAKQGNYKQAIGFFERARSLAPRQASVLNNLAMAYAMDGQADRGETLLREAQALGSDDPRLQKNMALLQELQKGSAPAGAATGEGSSAPLVDAPVLRTSMAAPAAPAAAGSAKSSKGKKPAAGTKTAGGQPLDPDQIIRAALDAEAAKKR
jgi:Flp pilus assembly protein TadD